MSLTHVPAQLRSYQTTLDAMCSRCTSSLVRYIPTVGHIEFSIGLSYCEHDTCYDMRVCTPWFFVATSFEEAHTEPETGLHFQICGSSTR